MSRLPLLSRLTIAGILLASAAPLARAQSTSDSTKKSHYTGACTRTSGHPLCWGALVGGTAPLGTYAKATGPGYFFGAFAQFALTHHFGLRAEADDNMMRWVDNGSGAVEYDAPFTDFAGAAVWEPRGGSADLFQPYLALGMGSYNVSVDQACYTYCTAYTGGSARFTGENAAIGARLVFPGHLNSSGFTALTEVRWVKINGAVGYRHGSDMQALSVAIGLAGRIF